MKRKDDWQESLNAVIEAARERPFSWGEHDCCVFSANCVEVMTDENPMKEFLGLYHDEQSAKALLATRGGKTLFRTLQKIFGRPIDMASAKRGDVVYRRVEGIPSVGICIGEYSVFVGVLQTDEGEVVGEGLVTIPTCNCMKAFKV